MNEKYIIIEKNILTEDQVLSKNNEFSDYELYQILEQNGYKTTNKNLQILKEGLNIKKYYILTESEKELLNNNEKSAILNILKSLTFFGFDTKLIEADEERIRIRSTPYKYENEEYSDLLVIRKNMNGDFFYFYRVIGPYMYSRLCFPKENEFFWRSISSNKEIAYECEVNDGFTKNINDLKKSLISNLMSIKNKRKKISSFKLEDDKSSQKNLSYTIVRNKVLTDDEIRELAKKTKKDVIALSEEPCWWDYDSDDIYGWVFTLNLTMTDLPPLASLNDAIYAYSKYKKYNIRPYFDREGVNDPIIEINERDKVFTVNKRLDDDHIFTAYSGDVDCYNTNRTLKVTKGERHRY